MNKTSFTNVRLSPKERAALQAAADSWGGTISEALRAAVRAQYMTPPGGQQKSEGHAVAIDRAGAPFCVQS